jgi:hypothetical protein
MHQLWPGAHLSNNAMLVVECDGAVDAGRVRRALDRLLDVCPWPAARLRRAFPWGKLHWAVGRRAALVAPPVREIAPPDRHRFLEEELGDAIDPRRAPPLRVSVLGATLVFTWFHPLMDPRGGQNLLGHLAHVDEHGGWDAGPPAFVPAPESRPLRERGRLARQSVEYMHALMSQSPVSPGTGLATPGRVRFRQQRFADPDPRAERRQITWRLAAVGRAMAELWRRRGLPDVPFLVPISVDLRAKGDPEPTFGNALAFHFARFRPSETADVPELERRLRMQMVAALRDDQIEANRVAMEFLHYRPLSMMLRDLPGTAHGETFSFNCADVGDFPPRLTALFGRRIVNAYHAPAVLPRPGVGVFFNRCAGRENVLVSWIEGAATDADVDGIVDVVGEAMRWTRA